MFILSRMDCFKYCKLLRLWKHLSMSIERKEILLFWHVRRTRECNFVKCCKCFALIPPPFPDAWNKNIFKFCGNRRLKFLILKRGDVLPLEGGKNGFIPETRHKSLAIILHSLLSKIYTGKDWGSAKNILITLTFLKTLEAWGFKNKSLVFSFSLHRPAFSL